MDMDGVATAVDVELEAATFEHETIAKETYRLH